ncbi:hypothetical protein [Bacillus sp. J33]|uniref:hypothetical protein n=1 Tax=Bacillus sp. J33 TaxID=935836 RepID=UPI00047C07D3|nr:hypothetical protein [Bacillus sp. J33]
MAVYLITYDLNKSGQNYESLYKEIKALGDWYHFMDSGWFVDVNTFTYPNATSINDKLIKVIDKNDWLFVTMVTSDRNGWLPKDAWDWLNSRS